MTGPINNIQANQTYNPNLKGEMIRSWPNTEVPVSPAELEAALELLLGNAARPTNDPNLKGEMIRSRPNLEGSVSPAKLEAARKLLLKGKTAESEPKKGIYETDKLVCGIKRQEEKVSLLGPSATLPVIIDLTSKTRSDRFSKYDKNDDGHLDINELKKMPIEEAKDLLMILKTFVASPESISERLLDMLKIRDKKGREFICQLMDIDKKSCIYIDKK